jgi:hypothetical protein
MEVIAVLGLVLLGRRPPVEQQTMPPTPWRAADVVLGAISLLALSVAVAGYTILTISEPHGSWDAWAIWNQRARFLFRAGDGWRNAFSWTLGWSHPDYPLLVPGVVVRGWVYAGAETQSVPALVGATYTFTTAGLLASGLAVLRGPTHGLVAGTILLSTPSFLLKGASQCADVPLGFYYLGALLFLALEATFSEHARRLAFLSGLMAGGAVWAKNEAVLFLACLVGVRAFAAFREARARAPLKWFGLGVVPALVLLGYFRVVLSPPNDFVIEQSWPHLVTSLLAPGRYADVLSAYARLVGHELAPAMAVSLACAVLLRLFRQDTARAQAVEPMAVLLLVASCYFMVYVTTPKPLAWHLETSLSRLVMQLWPSALLCGFLLCPRSRVATTAAGAQATMRGHPAHARFW